jgi:hypothetical protein
VLQSSDPLGDVAQGAGAAVSVGVAGILESFMQALLVDRRRASATSPRLADSEHDLEQLKHPVEHALGQVFRVRLVTRRLARAGLRLGHPRHPLEKMRPLRSLDRCGIGQTTPRADPTGLSRGYSRILPSPLHWRRHSRRDAARVR